MSRLPIAHTSSAVVGIGLALTQYSFVQLVEASFLRTGLECSPTLKHAL